MGQWQTADAKQRFSELVNAACHQGPQLIMCHTEPVAVVLSPDIGACLVTMSVLLWGTRRRWHAVCQTRR
jgi:prevent-host-death family protein